MGRRRFHDSQERNLAATVCPIGNGGRRNFVFSGSRYLRRGRDEESSKDGIGSNRGAAKREPQLERPGCGESDEIALCQTAEYSRPCCDDSKRLLVTSPGDQRCEKYSHNARSARGSWAHGQFPALGGEEQRSAAGTGLLRLGCLQVGGGGWLRAAVWRSPGDACECREGHCRSDCSAGAWRILEHLLRGRPLILADADADSDHGPRALQHRTSVAGSDCILSRDR